VTQTPLSRSKDQGHQAALLSTALLRKAAAAVSMGTYSVWESTATLRLFGGAPGAWASTGRGAGHIVSPRAQLVLLPLVVLVFISFSIVHCWSCFM